VIFCSRSDASSRSATTTKRYPSIHTPEVRARIEAGDETWEALVPAVVADTIKARQLFGYQAPPAARR
jgi:hypothetical protein